MRRALLAPAVLALCVPAAAQGHTGAGFPSNYLVSELTLRPALGPAQLRVYGGDDRLELRWSGDEELVVLGYAGEPYLRLSPDGAFENASSPSMAANAERFGQVVRAGSGREPSWRRVSERPVAVWHEHRAHWMSREPPAVVAAGAGRPVLVQRISVPVRVGGRQAEITGRLDHIPGPGSGR